MLHSAAIDINGLMRRRSRWHWKDDKLFARQRAKGQLRYNNNNNNNNLHTEPAPAVRAAVKTLLFFESISFSSETVHFCAQTTLLSIYPVERTPPKSFFVNDYKYIHYQYSIDVFLHLIKKYDTEFVLK